MFLINVFLYKLTQREIDTISYLIEIVEKVLILDLIMEKCIQEQIFMKNIPQQ